MTGGTDGAGEEYVACPTCTMQIPASSDRCPHCAQAIFRPAAGAAAGKGRAPSGAGPSASVAAGERFAFLPAPLRPYALWVVIGAGLAVALLALLLVYRAYVRVAVSAAGDPALPIRAEAVRDGDLCRVRGTVTNLGDDVPDFSLRSIRVAAEFLYRDGRKVERNAFPRNPYRGEGALLREEAGTFEFDAPAKGLREVRLEASVVDLSLGRSFVPGRGAPPGTAPAAPEEAPAAAPATPPAPPAPAPR